METEPARAVSALEAERNRMIWRMRGFFWIGIAVGAVVGGFGVGAPSQSGGSLPPWAIGVAGLCGGILLSLMGVMGASASQAEFLEGRLFSSGVPFRSAIWGNGIGEIRPRDIRAARFFEVGPMARLEVIGSGGAHAFFVDAQGTRLIPAVMKWLDDSGVAVKKGL